MLRLIAFFALGFIASAVPAFALPASCDSNFMDVMEARATMEAQRDTEMAATLLLKPDSVLAYSCFNKEVDNLNRAAQNMMSANVGPRLFHTAPPLSYPASAPGIVFDMFQPGYGAYGPIGSNYWKAQGTLYQHPLNTHPGVPQRGVAFQEDNTPPVGQGYPGGQGTPYQAWNPVHPLASALGSIPNMSYNEGIWDYSYPPYDNWDNPFPFPGPQHFNNTLWLMIIDALSRHYANNYNHTFLGGTGTSSEPCYVMRQVWDFARCDNFDREHFHTFAEMRSSDPRVLPQACGGGRMDWGSNIALANTPPGTAAGMKPMKTFLRQMMYDLKPEPECEKDSLVIGTGVTVYTDMATTEDSLGAVPISIGPFQEKICSLPGCYYDPVNKKCK